MSKFKFSYREAHEKRRIQREIFRQVKFDRFIGLGGPSIKDYAKVVNSFGQPEKEVVSYETNPMVCMMQMAQKPKGIEVRKGDILDHLEDKKAFYDLDFCCSIKTIEKYLPKIAKLKKFTMTLAIRPVGVEETKKILKKYIKNFTTYRYYDTTNMLTILVNKK